jgi:1-acyl-sn-glycerol-3-phosphate acyltransferase
VRGDEHIPTQRRGGAGVQPRELCRRHAADGGQPAAHPLRDGPPHLSGPGAGRAVPPGQGDPDRAAEGRPGHLYEAAFEAPTGCCADGDLLGIFPEGGITRDGQLQPFKGGIMKILERRPAPVVPLALRNLWGSYFSRIEDGSAMVRPFRRGLFNRVELLAGEPLPPIQVSPEGLRERVRELLER